MKYYDDIGYRKGSQGNLACSEKAAALLTQCAWCNRMMQDGKVINDKCWDSECRSKAHVKNLDASHGICETCFVEVMNNA